jgi:hypothetical protein
MRGVFAIPLLILIALPGVGCSEPPGIGPAASTDRNAANWADWDAQARITEGDYDGAAQAERLAEATRQRADREDLAARAAGQP